MALPDKKTQNWSKTENTKRDYLYTTWQLRRGNRNFIVQEKRKFLLY